MSTEQITNGLTGKNLLITGCSGFLGKVVLEKLLRCIPSVGKIYLLIRGNVRHPAARGRFSDEIATASVFDRLRKECPGGFKALCDEKIHVVSGEITCEKFGLTNAEFTELGKQVDIIINIAASVDFREPLDTALQINTQSLLHLAALAAIKKIPVVHVSTCYVNGYNGGFIRELVNPPAKVTLPFTQGNYFDVSRLLDSLQEKVKEVSWKQFDEKTATLALIKAGLRESRRYGWNDTYTFTKWLGEQVLLKAMQGQTLTIVRPSIIESTLSDPVPGWIEGVKVADAIILAYAREKISLFPGNKHAIIDIIPADLVANSIILSAAEALLKPGGHRIYQCSSSCTNPIALEEVIALVQAEAQQRHDQYKNLFYRRPQKPFVMVPSAVFSSVIYSSYYFTKARNGITAALGRAPSTTLIKNLETALTLSSVFSFYTRPNYIFSNENLCSMAKTMGAADSQQFRVDAAQFDWSHYLPKVHIAGLNQYALQPKSAAAKAIARQREMETA